MLVPVLCDPSHRTTALSARRGSPERAEILLLLRNKVVETFEDYLREILKNRPHKNMHDGWMHGQMRPLPVSYPPCCLMEAWLLQLEGVWNWSLLPTFPCDIPPSSDWKLLQERIDTSHLFIQLSNK